MTHNEKKGEDQDSARFAELDKLSSKELHDRAFRLAEHRLDIRFFWDLLKEIPAAEAMTGNLSEADLDIQKVSSLVTDAVESGRGEIEEVMRPIYLDYLMKHEKKS